MAVNQYTSESGPEPALPPEQKNSYIDHQTLLPVSTLPNKLEEETGSKQFHREPVIQDDSSTRLVKKLFVCECVCVCVTCTLWESRLPSCTPIGVMATRAVIGDRFCHLLSSFTGS